MVQPNIFINNSFSFFACRTKSDIPVWYEDVASRNMMTTIVEQGGGRPTAIYNHNTGTRIVPVREGYYVIDLNFNVENEIKIFIYQLTKLIKDNHFQADTILEMRIEKTEDITKIIKIVNPPRVLKQALRFALFKKFSRLTCAWSLYKNERNGYLYDPIEIKGNITKQDIKNYLCNEQFEHSVELRQFLKEKYNINVYDRDVNYLINELHKMNNFTKFNIFEKIKVYEYNENYDLSNAIHIHKLNSICITDIGDNPNIEELLYFYINKYGYISIIIQNHK